MWAKFTNLSSKIQIKSLADNTSQLCIQVSISWSWADGKDQSVPFGRMSNWSLEQQSSYFQLEEGQWALGSCSLSLSGQCQGLGWSSPCCDAHSVRQMMQPPEILLMAEYVSFLVCVSGKWWLEQSSFQHHHNQFSFVYKIPKPIPMGPYMRKVEFSGYSLNSRCVQKFET